MFRRLRSLICFVVPIAFAAVATGNLFAADAVTLGEDASLTAGIPGKGPLNVAATKKWLNDDANHETLTVKLPKGLDAGKANLYIPEDNPMTRAKIELGRQLYFDKRLSSDNTVSCASCHHPDKAFGFDTQFGVGVDDQKGDRNSPVSYNRIVSKAQFWDGRADSLEAQAVGPIANPIEMGNTHEKCVATLKAIPAYRIQFAKIFDDGVNIDNVGKAIAAFERTIVTQPAPYDFYQPIEKFEQLFSDDLDDLDEDQQDQYDAIKAAAKEHSMSESAVRGMKLFAKKAKCAECHAGANFSDEQYHNLGVGMEGENPDLGRFKVTDEDKDRGAFKTPTLRNVALSAPYMHDGSQKTLEEVVDWYNKGGHANKWLSDKVKKLELTDQEKKDLVAFMKEGLTSDFTVVNEGRLPAEPKAKKAGANAEKKADSDGENKTDADSKMKADASEKMAAKADAAVNTDTPNAAVKTDTPKPDAPRGYLGLTCDKGDLTISKVARVQDNSAAKEAGLQAGDVIFKVNDKKVTSFEELKAALADLKAGQEVTVRAKRGEEKITVKATLKPAS